VEWGWTGLDWTGRGGGRLDRPCPPLTARQGGRTYARTHAGKREANEGREAARERASERARRAGRAVIPMGSVTERGENWRAQTDAERSGAEL